jgi:hypothetical protein
MAWMAAYIRIDGTILGVVSIDDGEDGLTVDTMQVRGAADEVTRNPLGVGQRVPPCCVVGEGEPAW